MTAKPEDEAAPPSTPEGLDPNTALIAKAKQIIASTGRASIIVQLRRDGAEFPHPIRLPNVDAINDLPSLVFTKHGSGDFDYRVRVGGAIASPWLPLSIADDSPDGDEDEDEEDDEEDDLDQEDEDDGEHDERSLTPDEVVAAAADELERRQAERRAEEDRRAAEARAIQEPLLVQIAELKRMVTAAPPTPVVAPEILALRQTVDELKAALAAKERAEAEKQANAVEERLTKQIDELKAALATPKKKKRRDPLEHALEHLTRIAVVDKTLATLKERAGESEGGNLLEDSLKVFEEPLKNIMRDAAKNLEKTAKTTLRAQPGGEAAPSGSAAPAPGHDVPGDLVAWLQLTFKEQHRVLDVEFVRASLQKSPVLAAQLERLAACTNPEQLLKATTDLLGPPVTAAIQKEGPEYAQGIVQLCGALSRTIQATKTTPPPAPEKEKPAP